MCPPLPYWLLVLFYFNGTSLSDPDTIVQVPPAKTSERIADTFAYSERTTSILERQFGPQTVVERLLTQRGPAMSPSDRSSALYVIYITIFVLQMQRGKLNYILFVVMCRFTISYIWMVFVPDRCFEWMSCSWCWSSLDTTQLQS